MMLFLAWPSSCLGVDVSTGLLRADDVTTDSNKKILSGNHLIIKCTNRLISPNTGNRILRMGSMVIVNILRAFCEKANKGKASIKAKHNYS